jgi:hypothetical protein
MPAWLYGIGAVLIMLLRRPILGLLLGFFKREVASLLRVPAEQRLHREAAARMAAQRGSSPGDLGNTSG